MHLKVRPTASLRNTLICLGALAALPACGGDDDSGMPATHDATQTGTGGSHTGSGSGGSSMSTNNHPTGGSGGTGGMHGGSSGSGGSAVGSGGRSAGSGGSGVDAGAPDNDAGSSCFSPTQNLDTAYRQGAVGCACKDGDASQCIQGVALICDGTHWTAVEDGPCAPGPGPTRVSYSSKECEAIGGLVVGDPGDGSLLRNGCAGSETLGIIDNSKEPGSGIPIEGAMCCGCASAGADCNTGLVRCGARAGDTCDDTEFCGYLPGGLCGAADAESVCRTRPSDCTMLPQKVCGCDGKDYDNACVANKAGTGIKNLGGCAH